MPIKLITSGGGSAIITPTTNATDYTLTVPAVTANVVTTGDTGSITQAMMRSGLATTGPAFSATRTAAQTISATTWTKVQFAVEEYDTANCYDATTNYRFTPNVAGYYLINSIVETNTNSYSSLAIYKNGSVYRRTFCSNPSTGMTAFVTTVVYLNGSTDYVESYLYQNSTAALYNNSTPDYEFSGYLLRAA